MLDAHTVKAALLPLSLCLLLPAAAWGAPHETYIKEVAPGVFFRKAQTEPTFTGCNQGFVIFKEYVLVIDANFPGQAAEVIQEIKKHSSLPIRYVFDTHHHGDHADGNVHYTKLGAIAVAALRSRPLFDTKGAQGFENAKTGRAAEYGKLVYEKPSLYFDQKLVLDDGTQRVEFLWFGHGHTAGDAVAWLPQHGVLFTGDACVNGAFNYLGDADTASWITVLNAFDELPAKIVCPGHGELAGKELIGQQRRYFVELRTAVKQGIDQGRSLDDLQASLDIPWYREWAGVEAKTRTENIAHVYGELTGGNKPNLK